MGMLLWIPLVLSLLVLAGTITLFVKVRRSSAEAVVDRLDSFEQWLSGIENRLGHVEKRADAADASDLEIHGKIDSKLDVQAERITKLEAHSGHYSKTSPSAHWAGKGAKP